MKYDVKTVILCTCLVALVVKNLLANAGCVRDVDSIPGLGRSPQGENGNQFQYSCLENPMDRGAWRATYSPWGLRAILGFLSPGSQSVSSRSVEIAQLHVRAKSLQLFPAFCDPMDCSPPGPSVHGILQARTQEWVAISSFRGSS